MSSLQHLFSPWGGYIICKPMPISYGSVIFVQHALFCVTINNPLFPTILKYGSYFAIKIRNKLALLYTFTSVYRNIPSFRRDESKTSFPHQEE